MKGVPEIRVFTSQLSAQEQHQMEGQPTGSNTVAVERRRLGLLLSLATRFLCEFLSLLRRPESTRPLLVHLCSGSNAVHSHEEYLEGEGKTVEMSEVS